MVQSKQRKLIFTLAAVVCILCLAEILSFVFFSLLFRERFTFHEVDQFMLLESERASLEARYDKRYGWDYRHDTGLNERPRPVTYDRPFMAAFGDSYTHCTGVEDDETWQTYLAELLQADVYNFGTGGYGTDQAYLKYLDLKSKIETPVVALGLISENINRVVNVYRPFYFPKTGIRLPKPRFVLSDGELTLLENPLRGPEEIGRLAEEKFIRMLGRHDYWYNRDNHPVRRFPYVRILFNKRMWLEAIHGKPEKRIDDVDPRPWENLWKEREAADLMFAILESFIEDVERSGRVPLIMIMPLQDEVFEKLYTGTDPESIEMIKSFCARRGCLCFNTVDALVKSVSEPAEIPALYAVHLSPAGNRVVARELHAFIKERIRDL